jgi:hypothetical protein
MIPGITATRPRRRIDADDDAHDLGHARHPPLLDQRPAPQGARCLLDQFAVQFLPADPRAAIDSFHRRDEIGRQMRAVARRPPPRHNDSILRQQPPHQRHRARGRRRHRPRLAAKAQAHHQIVPHGHAARPFADLVGPGEMMLRSAQTLRLGGRI